MKPPTNSFWSHELPWSADTLEGLLILLKFMINVEEKFLNESSTSTSKSDRLSCSTISPETEKLKGYNPIE